MLTGKLVSFLLVFVSGVIFAAAMIWLSFDASKDEARVQLHKALRSLALFSALGIAIFSAAVGVFAWRSGEPLTLVTAVPVGPASTQQPAPNSSAVTASQAMTASRLTGIPLPAEAHTVTDSDIVNTSLQQLRQLAQQIDAPSALGASEVLMWRGTKSERPASEARIAAVEKSLQEAGWVYRRTSTPGDAGKSVREFVAVNTKEKKIVPGFWLITDEFLLLCWGELAPRG